MKTLEEMTIKERALEYEGLVKYGSKFGAKDLLDLNAETFSAIEAYKVKNEVISFYSFIKKMLDEGKSKEVIEIAVEAYLENMVK